MIQLELLHQSSTVRALISLVAGIQCRVKSSTLSYQTLIRALSYAMWEDADLRTLDPCVLQDAYCLPTMLPEIARRWATEGQADVEVNVIPELGDDCVVQAVRMLQRWTGLNIRLQVRNSTGYTASTTRHT